MKSLRKAAEDYIALRRSLGFKLRDMATGLSDFVSFMAQKATPHITTALALEWATLPQDHQPSDWARRLGFVRVFARHWSATDPHTEIPPDGLLHFERNGPILIYTRTRRFKSCSRRQCSFRLSAGFGRGPITVYLVFWS